MVNAFSSFIRSMTCVVCADLAVNAKESLEGARPGMTLRRQIRRGRAQSLQILAAEFFDRVRQGRRRVLRRPRFLFVKYDSIQVRTANPNDRRAASLALQRDQPERFLRSRMHEHVRGAVETCELERIRAVLNRRNASCLRLQPA